MILDFSVTTVADALRGREQLGVVGLDDARLADARPALPHSHPEVPHALLSALHSDTVPGKPERGDILSVDTTNRWNKLRIGLANTVLVNPVGYDPVWAKVDLTAMVSGVLPVANGGTGATEGGTFGEIDGGHPDSTYGGADPVDGGTP